MALLGLINGGDPNHLLTGMILQVGGKTMGWHWFRMFLEDHPMTCRWLLTTVWFPPSYKWLITYNL